MKREEQTKRNLELFSIFMEKALDSSSLRDLIPNKSDLVFLPDNDPELRQANLQLAEELRAQGKTPILIKISYVTQTMTVLVPTIELVETA
jgi:hypothetical protein